MGTQPFAMTFITLVCMSSLGCTPQNASPPEPPTVVRIPVEPEARAPALASANNSSLTLSEDGLELVPTIHAQTPPPPDAVMITVRSDAILLDGALVGDPREVQSAGRLKKIDGLFATLKQRREQFKVQHPGEVFPGRVVLRMAPETSALVIKSVFQTAAFAGYPNEAFLVATPRGRGVLPMNAQVPGPPESMQPIGLLDPTHPQPPATLRIDASSPDRFSLIWKQGATVVSSVEAPSVESAKGSAGLLYPGLADKIAAEWAQRGSHKAQDDRAVDQAVIALGNDASLRRLVGVLDAILSVRRVMMQSSRAENVPAFDVILSVY